METISVIIPTLNEGAVLGLTLQSIRETSEVEIIVVDGGSQDQTLEIARRYAETLSSGLGRGRQMNKGARHARGGILLFLHADSILPAMALSQISNTLKDPEVVGGAFRLGINTKKLLLRMVATFANWRTAITRIPYGDQGIFVRRSVFEKIGGYSDQALMEDLEFSRRLKRQGRLVLLPDRVLTSSRRWDQEGIFYTTVRNQALVFLYFLGVSPERLARWYRQIR